VWQCSWPGFAEVLGSEALVAQAYSEIPDGPGRKMKEISLIFSVFVDLLSLEDSAETF